LGTYSEGQIRTRSAAMHCGLDHELSGGVTGEVLCHLLRNRLSRFDQTVDLPH
jgi:hypothetical protein